MVCLSSCRKAADSNEALLRELDHTLAQKDSYEAAFLQRISVLRELREGKNTPEQEYELNKALAAEFTSYSKDSALAYLGYNLTIANRMGDRLRLAETNLMRAREYAIAGYLSDAEDIFDNFQNGEEVPAGAERLYYSVGNYLYGEIAAYSSNNAQYWRRRTYFLNGHLDRLEEGSYEWLDLKRIQADEQQDKAAAKEYALQALAVTSPGTRDYARAAYFASTYQPSPADRIPLLAESVKADVMCATKDYASLNELAVILFSQGDIDRAFHYAADHSMPDAILFNGKLRPWQIAQFFPQLEKAYAQKSDHNTRMLVLLIGIAFLLLAALASLIWYLSRRQALLVKTRQALEDEKARVERRNAELSHVNERLTALNGALQESSKVRQEYIALFLQNLSENISTTRQYKNHVLKYIRRGNDKYLIEEIEALPPIEEDISEFNRMFDRTFINLYPDFVEKFNALLADGEAITPKGEDILTPELRVFALIKLGISESARIASLLHYSANTVYNYRAKIKNKARGDREHFEEAVQAIE